MAYRRDRVSCIPRLIRRASLHRYIVSCTRLALIVLPFGAITPLAYVMPADQTWIGGLYDNADHDDVILAVIGLDGAPDNGGPVFFQWTALTQLRSSPHPVSITSHSRLTLTGRAPPPD